jgi:peptidoglycan/xylan/chitin deacetylase (PgdA/CDA1 family)
VTILCYHTVERGWRSPLAVTPEEFSAQVEWLARSREVVDVAEAVARMSPSGHLPRNVTALTFDDGFAGVREHAFPLLARHRLPATVFLVAQTLTPEGKAIDWASTPPASARTLALDEVREMQEAGVRFGSHTYSHPDLRSLSEEECVRDLRTSRELLEDLLGRSVPFLAYPFGFHNETARRAAAKAGFSHAFALPEGREPVGRYAVPRAVIVPGNSVKTVRFKSSRWYVPLRRSGVFPALRKVARRTGGGLRLPG